MIKLNDLQLNNISGSLNLSGSLVASFSKSIAILLELGRSLGSAFRRSTSGRLCPL